MKELEGKNILITGAFGLIGWNLQKSIEAANIKCQLWLLKCDELPEGWPLMDIIIHAAGYGQPSKFLQDKVKTITLNTTLTTRLLELLKPEGKFLFVSTSEVYSGLQNPPFKEMQIGLTGPDHPRACYIEGKRCGEAICRAYFDMGRNVKIARLALAYGPGVKKGDGRVLHSLIERAFHGDLTLLDAGDAQRTYCYVSDAIEMMWKILLHGTQPVYNVGGVSKTTILELAEMIGSKIGAKVFPGDQGMVDAPDVVELDIKRYEREFGKRDFVSLEDGLDRTIEWQKSL